MENIDIFITAFKDFKEQVSDKRYKIIEVKDFNYKGKLESYKDNIGDNISDMNCFYNELTAYYWVWKNYQLKEYIGMCSYRRYFDFFDNIDIIEDMLKNNDIILPKKEILKEKTLIEHYGNNHNVDDLKMVLDILCEKHPSYINDCEKIVNDNKIYCNGMFIMKKEDFINYCEFLFPIIEEFLKRKQFNNCDDVLKHVVNNKEKYIKNVAITKSPIYQSRIGGFLNERLLTIFVNHNFKNIVEIPMIFTCDVNDTTSYFNFDEKLLNNNIKRKFSIKDIKC